MTDLAPNMIQELPWTPAVQAIKDSVHFDDFTMFRAHLEENLPYNCQGQVITPQNGQGNIPQLKCSVC